MTDDEATRGPLPAEWSHADFRFRGKPAKVRADFAEWRVRRERWVKQKAREAQGRLPEWIGATVVLATVSAALFWFGDVALPGWDGWDWWLALAIALAAVVVFFVALATWSDASGEDAKAGDLAAIGAFLDRILPELHPGAPMELDVDLGPITGGSVYKRATSPYSGSEKVSYRKRRSRLAGLLADGTVFACEVEERAKLKAGSQLWARGLVRVRMARKGARPARSGPADWTLVPAGDDLLAWRRTGAVDLATALVDPAPIHALLERRGG